MFSYKSQMWRDSFILKFLIILFTFWQLVLKNQEVDDEEDGGGEEGFLSI